MLVEVTRGSPCFPRSLICLDCGEWLTYVPETEIVMQTDIVTPEYVAQRWPRAVESLRHDCEARAMDAEKPYPEYEKGRQNQNKSVRVEALRARKEVRKCLRCSEEFASDGAHNRLCLRCNEKFASDGAHNRLCPRCSRSRAPYEPVKVRWHRGGKRKSDDI